MDGIDAEEAADYRRVWDLGQQELQQVKARQDEVTNGLQKANEHVQQQLSESKRRHIEELEKANEHSKNVEHQLSESKNHHIEELQKAY